MVTVGLTGNIGSGKSLVAEIFSVLGVPVFSADLAGRQVLEHTDVIARLRNTFGNQIIGAWDTIDRKALGALVFSDSQALQQLNAIVHPHVRDKWLIWAAEQQSHPYVLHEAAILVESGFHKLTDQLILVSAPLEIRMERVKLRDGIGDKEFLDRAAQQWPEEKLRGFAEHVIDNGGKIALIPQVVAIDKILRGTRV